MTEQQLQELAESRATANRAEAAGARADRDVAIVRAERAERLLDEERKRRQLAYEQWDIALRQAKQAEEASTIANTTQRNLHDVLRETQAERDETRHDTRLRDALNEVKRERESGMINAAVEHAECDRQFIRARKAEAALTEARRVLREVRELFPDTGTPDPDHSVALYYGQVQQALAAVLAQEAK